MQVFVKEIDVRDLYGRGCGNLCLQQNPALVLEKGSAYSFDKGCDDDGNPVVRVYREAA